MNPNVIVKECKIKWQEIMSLSLGGLLTIFTGCANTQQTYLNIQRPAEINMAGYEKIRLDGISGQGGQLINAKLRTALANTGKFTLVDRGSMTAAAQERALSDLNAQQDVTTANVSIKGDVLLVTPRQERLQQVMRDYKTGREYYVYANQGSNTAQVSFTVTDLATSELITTKTFTGEASTQTDWYNDNPPNIDMNGLFDNAAERVVQQFMKTIAPYYESIAVNIYKFPKNTANTTGQGLFAGRQYLQAAKAFEEALATSQAQPEPNLKEQAQITHNIGLAYECAGNFNQAAATYQNVLALDPEGKAAPGRSSLNRVSVRQTDVGRLKQQGVLPAN